MMKNQGIHLAKSMKRIVVRPSRGILARQRLTDHIRPGVRILFVGINPGLRSAATGHHFAGHSNRFWKLLFESKLAPEPLTHQDDWRLPDWGLGLTNIIQRPSAGIDVLKPREYIAGRKRLIATVTTLSPSCSRPAWCHDLSHVIPRIPDWANQSRVARQDLGRLPCFCPAQSQRSECPLFIPSDAHGVLRIAQCDKPACSKSDEAKGLGRTSEPAVANFLQGLCCRDNRSCLTLGSVLDKESVSNDIHTLLSWHMDCCISRVPLVDSPSTG